MLRASMRHAGAIRLDHVLGLKRLYLVPHGFGAADGVYVQMPFEALLAVTAQESVANRCVVIGEDLGTVPEGFREQIRRLGHLVVSGDDVRARRPRRVPRHRPLLAQRARHLQHPRSLDLCRLASFNDLKLKRSLGIDPGESDDARWHALAMLDDVLRHHGIGDNDLYVDRANFWRGPNRACWRSRWRICWAWSTSPTSPAPSTNIRTGGGACRCASTRLPPRWTSPR